MSTSELQMKSVRLPLLLALLMGAVAIATHSVRLSSKANPAAPTFVLEELLPASFSEWRTVESGAVQVVNPQAQQLLDKLYSQVLTRLYAHADGYQLMLSIAYGHDQSAGLQVHLPELCYPAQGFVVDGRTRATMTTTEGPLPVNRMEARLGSRIEPVTYWFRLGGRIPSGISSLDWRVEQVRFAFSGAVPDGLLFRVSSIDDNRQRAYKRQEQFIADLLAAVGPSDRAHLVGILPR